jgi:hypothetical protein
MSTASLIRGACGGTSPLTNGNGAGGGGGSGFDTPSGTACSVTSARPSLANNGGAGGASTPPTGSPGASGGNGSATFSSIAGATTTPGQQLATALKACEKLKSSRKHEACVSEARKRYVAQELAAAVKTCDKLKKPKQRAKCVAAAHKKY